MHVMTKYLDTRKAAIEALRDFHLMEQTAKQSVDEESEKLLTDAASPQSPRTDGLPSGHDPHAGEQRLAHTLDQIDLLKQRKTQAQEYLDWFLPAWATLSEDDRYIIEQFFLTEGSQEEKVEEIADHFYVERNTVYRKKTKALDRFAAALYGRL